MDSLSEGTQVLREFIVFSNLNFIKLCQDFDQYETRALSKDTFRNCLKASPLYFTPTNIEQIYQDSPKTKNGEVLYPVLFKWIQNAPKPRTRFSFKNLYNLKRTEKLMKNQAEVDQEIEYDMGNFFDRRKKFDFRHYELFRLELEYLRTNPMGPMEEKPSFEEYEIKKNLKEFYKLNNQLILDNFQTLAAQEIALKFHPNYQKKPVMDEVLETSFCKFFGFTDRRKYELITNEDFRVMLVKLKVDLTPDEVELLRYLVFKGTEFTAFNARSFIVWLNHRRSLRIKELLKMDFRSETPFQEKEFPKILKSLVTLAYNFGTSFIETSLKPFLYGGNKLQLENLKEFLKSANHEVEASEWVEFQLYLANNNYLSLSDYSDLKTARFFIEIERLVKCLKDNFKVLGLADKEFQAGINEGNAVDVASKGIFEQTLNVLEKKLMAYCDEAMLIDEVKLRALIASDFPLIDQNALNLIFNKMNNNIPMSQFSGFQKVFLPEFMSILHSGNFSIARNQEKKPTLEEKKKRTEAAKPAQKNETYSSGFVRHAISYSKTGEYNPEASLERVVRSLENLSKQTNMTYKDPLTVATVFPLLAFCREKDYLQDGSIRLEHFKAILENNLALANEDLYQMLAMAEEIALLDKKDAYGFENEKFIAYNYFCMQFEKTLLIKKSLRQKNSLNGL